MRVLRGMRFFIIGLVAIALTALVSEGRLSMSNGAPPVGEAIGQPAGGGPIMAALDPDPSPLFSLATEEADDTPGGKDRVALGDRLSVKFHEKIDVLGGPGRRNGFGLVEQTMMSGDYSVQQSGEIVFPVLGAIDAADLSTGDLERDLRKAYASAFKQNARVSVTIGERQPIYVLGTGATAGTYKFVPGMTVLHALALVGSADDERQRDVYLQSELVRQRERLDNSRRQLMKLIARSLVLNAERDNHTAESNERLSQLAGRSKAAALIREEQDVRNLIARVRRMEFDAQRSRVAAATQEIGEITKNIAILAENMNVKRERKRTIASLRDQKLANTFIENQVASELLDATEREHQAQLSLSRAQHRVEDAEAILQKMVADHQLELSRDIASAEQSITELETAVLSSEQFVNELRLQSARTLLTKQPVSFEIVRQTRTGPEHMRADEMTELKPGDLVRASVAQAAQN